MKVSYNWIKEYTDVDIKASELVKKIGSQIGEVEDVLNLTKLYENIRIVRVISCEPHPQADKLSLCKIDDGRVYQDVERDSNGLIQIVCGAPNIRENINVVWIPPGATVPETANKDPFVIEKKEIRGKLSNGMLSSPKELVMGENHDGILIIDEEVKPGQLFGEFYGLNDFIIEIENKMLTHRPDLFGQIGLAREIAGINHHKFKSPDWYLKPKELNIIMGSSSLIVKNQIPDLVPRFIVQVIKGVTIKPSTKEIQSYLHRVGLKPINNIVDLTNYYMYLTAQPLHVYDLDKLTKLDESSKATIIVRHPKESEGLALLNGKNIKLNKNDIIIASDKKPIGLAGIMGGSETEVDNSTQNIVVECANFDMYAIRRSSMAHGLFTDALTRFNKGQSPLQNDRILAKMISDILVIAGGVVEAPIDVQATLPKEVSLKVRASFINKKLGINLKPDVISDLLTNVEFKVSIDEDNLTIFVPFWRTDIHIAEDIVEEIGRLYGYDNLVLSLPVKSIAAAPKNGLFELKTNVRDILVSAGSNELLTYNFISKNLLEKVGQDVSLAFQLKNPLSPELEYYRISLLPSLLDKVHLNIKAGFSEFCLFEINKTHNKNTLDEYEPELPNESYRLAMVIAADDKLAKKDYSGAPYYQAKYYLEYLLSSLGVKYEIQPYSFEPESDEGRQLLKPFEVSRTGFIIVNDEWIGLVGEPTTKVKNSLKLPKYSSMIELDFLKLYENLQPKKYKRLSSYQFTEQDICFKVDSELPYSDLYGLLDKELTNKVSNSQILLTLIDIYQRDDDKDHKQITFRLRINSYEHTFKTSEINEIINNLAQVTKQKFNAEII